MSTEIVVSEAPKTGVIVQHGSNVEVTASTPDEMAIANTALVQWAENKLTATRDNAKELRAAYEVAVKRKWASGTLKRHADMEDKRVIFYDKILGALRLGFMIVPNFPVTAFAIRTDRNKPLKMLTFSQYVKYPGDKQQKPNDLAIGEGDYENPFPLVYNVEKPVEGQPHRKEAAAFSWAEMEFPVTMAKSHIMEATSRAMALKLFDDFAILPAATIKQDPMIIARLRDPKTTGYGGHKYVSFMIAWHLNTAVL